MTHQHVLNTNTTSSYSFFSFYPSPLKDITITTNHSLTHIMYVLMNDSLLWWCLLVYGMCVGPSLCWVYETGFTGNLTGKQSSSLLTYDDAGGVDLFFFICVCTRQTCQSQGEGQELEEDHSSDAQTSDAQHTRLQREQTHRPEVWACCLWSKGKKGWYNKVIHVYHHCHLIL